ncbi:MAG: pyruvate oxidoreductase [Thermoprotei archaeon]|nr:MAG: pyruvate oxidoreductase [Thermoprotei archaeon]
MFKYELVIAGLGGHGIIFMGRVLGYAAILAGKDAVMMTSYSPAQRGGWSKAYIIVSDESISYPVVSEADALVATTLEMLKSEIKWLKKGGILIVDSDLIKDPMVSEEEYRVYKVPARTIAKQETGNERTSNMVLLGALVGLTGIVEPKHIEESIRTSVRRKELIEPNIRSFISGYNIAKETK